ncbi:sugar phosphate isomerase/epimerase family protein [Pseudooceanicola nanhaiensis]|uniref:sugar phosphate isomerase/epimerase family protein n=1 Tax=Pseudooceanicola nanhaiensis TaxID=375761 RepID=UPI001CD33F57|nr:sugar phosphate isomerase/epimerase family protein [Pseudooceanicola nanhaiensis]MCA0920417.1 sugar phosphate isomerase/epimerase [Pseudooceanicola nanhaiensis]
MTSLPVLGAAMPLDVLETYRDWILEDQRDLELQDFISAEVLNGDAAPLVERARKLLDGHSGRLGIHGPFWGLTLANPDADMRALTTKRMEQGLAVCEALGATQMVIHSPYTTWMYNNLDNQRSARQDVVDLVHATLDPVIARAEAANVTMVIENIEDKDADARVALAQSFDSASVKVSIDTGHAHYAHGSTGAHPVDYFVLRAGNMLEHIHIQDADGHADRHWEIGKGTVNWPAVFGALATLESNPRLIMELRDKSGLLASAKYLNDLGLAR